MFECHLQLALKPANIMDQLPQETNLFVIPLFHFISPSDMLERMVVYCQMKCVFLKKIKQNQIKIYFRKLVREVLQ